MGAEVKNSYRTPGDTNEHVIHVGRCLVWGVFPENTTNDIITLRDGAVADGSGTTMSVSAAALTQEGKEFGGVFFGAGLTVQLANALDLSEIVWEAL